MGSSQLAFWSKIQLAEHRVFCPGVRWAGTVDMLGLLTFWPAFLLFLLFELMAMVPLGGCCCCGWMMVLTYYRNQLRVAFGMAGSNEPATEPWTKFNGPLWVCFKRLIFGCGWYASKCPGFTTLLQEPYFEPRFVATASL